MGNFKFLTAFLFAFLFSVMGYGQEVLLNGGFESGTAKWKSYCDAAGTAPVDGVGGGVAGFAISSSTTSPLAGKSSGIITKDAANRQGCGVASDFTLANENKAKVLQIKIPYQVTSGTYADDQYKVYVYDVDNATMIEAAPTFIKNSSLVEQYRGVFQATLTGVNYRLIIHNASTSAVASTLRIEASVSSQTSAQGSFIGQWQSYTPTFTGFGTVSGVEFQWRQFGDSIQIRGKFVGGTSTAVEARISLPNGMLSASTDRIPSIQSTGAFAVYGHATTTGPLTVLIEPSVGYITIGWQNTSNAGLTKLQGTTILASTQTLSIGVSTIPIAGMGSNSALSSEYSARSASLFATLSAFTHTSSGSLQTVTGWSGSDNLGAWNASTGIYTCPYSGFYKVSAVVGYGASTTGARYLALRKNSTDVAIGDQKNAANFGAGATVTTSVMAGSQCNAGETLQIRAFQNSGGSLTFSAGTETHISIWLDTGGTQVAANEYVAAKVYGATTTIGTGQTTIIHPTKEFDTHNAYNTSTGLFTCPINGKYRITAAIYSNAATSSASVNRTTQLSARRDGASFVNLIAYLVYQSTSGIEIKMSGSTVMDCLAGQQLEVSASRVGADIASYSLSGQQYDTYAIFERVGN